MVVKVRSLEWFEENAFRDDDGDYWKTMELRDAHNEMRIGTVSEVEGKYVPKKVIGKVLKHINQDFYNKHKWIVEEILTQNEYPEYFL